MADEVEGAAQRRFAAARVARLATVGQDGGPHLVPVVFALEGDTLWTAVDGKPKSTTSLRRLANIRANPRVSLLVDHYEDDWSALWWVRADGEATVLPSGSGAETGALGILGAKYPQYRLSEPPGPVIAVRIITWRAWSAR